ncbi:MAG TPA: hypothetical protein VFB13_06045 [Reyranella sp.]|nr:hypothetical protein [Reyranella sp.]
MFDLPGVGKSTATYRGAGETEFGSYQRQGPPAIELVLRWALRLALLLVVALSGLVIYWIWFEPGKASWLQLAGTFPLALSVILVAIWAACAWE